MLELNETDSNPSKETDAQYKDTDEKFIKLFKVYDALNELDIRGIPTTIPLHIALAKDKNVLAGNYNTDYLEGWLESNFNQLEQASQGGV